MREEDKGNTCASLRSFSVPSAELAGVPGDKGKGTVPLSLLATTVGWFEVSLVSFLSSVLPLEIIVVDNASSDNSVEWLK